MCIFIDKGNEDGYLKVVVRIWQCFVYQVSEIEIVLVVRCQWLFCYWWVVFFWIFNQYLQDDSVDNIEQIECNEEWVVIDNSD